MLSGRVHVLVSSANEITSPICSQMTLSDDVNVEEYIMSKDDLSGADIKAICTEAGLMALRFVDRVSMVIDGCISCYFFL